MFDQNMDESDDIDYENLDDLPLLDHIEWNHYVAENVAAQDPSQFDWLDG